MPRLDRSEKSEANWVRSAKARKRLNLSTCELAHLRGDGKIAFKKEGNAFLYKLPSDVDQAKV